MLISLCLIFLICKIGIIIIFTSSYCEDEMRLCRLLRTVTGTQCHIFAIIFIITYRQYQKAYTLNNDRGFFWEVEWAQGKGWTIAGRDFCFLLFMMSRPVPWLITLVKKWWRKWQLWFGVLVETCRGEVPQRKGGGWRSMVVWGDGGMLTDSTLAAEALFENYWPIKDQNFFNCTRTL